MINLILLGAPGSGKGTQSALLVDGKGYKHISTGNLLRDEISRETKLGLKVKGVMESGQLVSDELVVELLKSNLELSDNSYIFDGYPRNFEQAKTLDSILEPQAYKVVYFALDTQQLVERLSNRRVTKDGKNIYNLLSNPPKVSGICDVTGESLIQRDDDKEEVVRKRMEVFESTISPVLEFYRKSGKLIEINANQNLNSIYNAVIAEIG